MRRVIVAVAVAVAALTACGQPGDRSQGRVATANPNDADVTFVQTIIPHHEQAIRMAKFVDSRTERPELHTLAGAILRTHVEELTLMRSWLRQWGQSEKAGTDQGETTMPGMLPEDEIVDLMGRTEVQFDLAFADLLRQHHRGAIELAQTELRAGFLPQVKELAQQVIDARQREVDQLARWRQEWATQPTR